MSVVLIARVGAAAGARSAAAALACAVSDRDRAALLVELEERRPARSTPLAGAAARALEERLAAHLPEAVVASRGAICRLSLPPDAEGLERLAAALPLAREGGAVVHLPPSLVQAALERRPLAPAAALLRADLGRDRALAALAARELIGRGIRVAVLKRPPGRLLAQAALLGCLPPGAAALPPRLLARLLEAPAGMSHRCYSDCDGKEADPAGTAQQERRDHAGARRGRGVRRHPQRGAGR